MTDFIKKISDFRQKVERKSTRVFQHACSNVSFSIAEKSPCSTGKLIGQWSPGAGSRMRYDYQGGISAWKGGHKDESIASANRAKAMSNLSPRINTATEALSKKEKYYFTNHTSYARQAEYQGWKITKRYAMVLRASQEFKSATEQIIARYRDA